MTTRRAFAMFSSYLLVNLLLVSMAVASDFTFQVNYPKHDVEIDDQSGLPFDVRVPEGSLRCPNVCPVCPSCKPSIPPGYIEYADLGYYKMRYEELAWPDAKAACEREGGYLVVLNSQKEADLATSFLTKYSITLDIHVGFFDVTKKGTYITVLGGPLTSTGFTKWRPNQPNSVGGENCGSYHPNIGLDDMHCTYKRPFLCELFP